MRKNKHFDGVVAVECFFDWSDKSVFVIKFSICLFRNEFRPQEKEAIVAHTLIDETDGCQPVIIVRTPPCRCHQSLRGVEMEEMAARTRDMAWEVRPLRSARRQVSRCHSTRSSQ